MVDIVINEPLIKHINEYDGIIVGTNCYQVMRNGFQNDISKKYKYVRELNYQTKYGDVSKLGTILECKEDGNQLFILCFVTFGYNFRGCDDDFFDYNALVKCLKLINILYRGYHFATTMIGCTTFDGNANKSRILDIINKEITNFDLTIYDYKQDSYGKNNQKQYRTELKKRYERNKCKNRLGKEISTQAGE